MPRNKNSSPTTAVAKRYPLILIFITSCLAIYFLISTISKPIKTLPSSSNHEDQKDGVFDKDCCRGVEHLELWGDAVKWGSQFKVKSSKECCMACKEMSAGRDGLCNSWVFCGDQKACGTHFGECWLKRQNDLLNPERRDSGNHVMWTSGLVFRNGLGIVALETKYGTMRIKLLPDCAPYSVAYILQLVGARHCAGCHFYRAEGRGNFWDSEGNHLENTPFGPPFALIQGRLEAQGVTFNDIPSEVCPRIERGSVAWIGSGPEFFISLAKHNEWRKPYTVFGYVIPEDMEIAEKIVKLPTRPEVWSNISVSVLENIVPLRMRRAEATLHSNMNLKKSENTV